MEDGLLSSFKSWMHFHFCPIILLSCKSRDHSLLSLSLLISLTTFTFARSSWAAKEVIIDYWNATLRVKISSCEVDKNFLSLSWTSLLLFVVMVIICVKWILAWLNKNQLSEQGSIAVSIFVDILRWQSLLFELSSISLNVSEIQLFEKLNVSDEETYSAD